MSENRNLSVKDFYLSLNLDHDFDGDAIAVNVNLLLEAAAEFLGGKLSYETCISKNTQHKRIVIEYDHAQKDRQNP